jgi:hypothetical protein
MSAVSPARGAAIKPTGRRAAVRRDVSFMVAVAWRDWVAEVVEVQDGVEGWLRWLMFLPFYQDCKEAAQRYVIIGRPNPSATDWLGAHRMPN